jgi:hypothetical protein
VKYEPRSIPVVYKGAPAPAGSGSIAEQVALQPRPDPQPSTSKHGPTDDPTFTGKGVNDEDVHRPEWHIQEPSEEDDEVVAEFQSDGSNSSSGRSNEDPHSSEDEDVVFEVDVDEFEVDVEDRSRQPKPQFSPPLHRRLPPGRREKLGGEEEIYDSDPEGKEEHDDQLGEPCSP